MRASGQGSWRPFSSVNTLAHIRHHGISEDVNDVTTYLPGHVQHEETAGEFIDEHQDFQETLAGTHNEDPRLFGLATMDGHGKKQGRMRHPIGLAIRAAKRKTLNRWHKIWARHFGGHQYQSGLKTYCPKPLFHLLGDFLPILTLGSDSNVSFYIYRSDLLNHKQH